MTTKQELTAAEKARVARTTVTHEPKLEGCVDCEEKAPIRAVIVSPNLGTPLVLSPGQTKCSVFIAANTPLLPPAYNLCNSFTSLYELVKAFATGDAATQKADVLVTTGDLLDFNRNLDPNAIPPNSIAGQWRAFNVLNNIRNPELYKRGLDDMLVYSLLRHAYQTWNLPVFLTTGNHEAWLTAVYGQDRYPNKDSIIKVRTEKQS